MINHEATIKSHRFFCIDATLLCEFEYNCSLRRQYITADERQPWTNYEKNGNECLIIGAVVRSKYSNIRYQQLIIGIVQNFVWSHKNDFQE